MSLPNSSLSLDFTIHASGTLCKSVLALGFTRFDQLAEHVRSLQYGRTSNAANLLAVLEEGRGTCSSKHQLLASVAHECGHYEVQLTIGIYEMSEKNTPGVGTVLSDASLSSIPEAHCYLIVNGKRFDFTGLSSGSSSPFDTLLIEHSVSPAELAQMKIRLHMQAVETWAAALGISAVSAWTTREACITALSANQARAKSLAGHLL